MTVKKFLIYVVISVAAYQLITLLPKNEVKTTPIVYFTDENAVKEILSKEKKVLGFTLSYPGWVYASMINDGTRRDGYAEYLCLSLTPYLSYEVIVKVVDYKDVAQKKGFTEMGIARCKPAKQEVKQ